MSAFNPVWQNIRAFLAASTRRDRSGCGLSRPLAVHAPAAKEPLLGQSSFPIEPRMALAHSIESRDERFFGSQRPAVEPLAQCTGYAGDCGLRAEELRFRRLHPSPADALRCNLSPLLGLCCPRSPFSGKGGVGLGAMPHPAAPRRRSHASPAICPLQLGGSPDWSRWRLPSKAPRRPNRGTRPSLHRSHVCRLT